MSNATDPPSGSVEEIAAQDSDEGTDGALEQYYDLAAVVEDTTPGVGQQSIVHGMRNQRHSNKKRTTNAEIGRWPTKQRPADALRYSTRSPPPPR